MVLFRAERGEDAHTGVPSGKSSYCEQFRAGRPGAETFHVNAVGNHADLGGRAALVRGK